MTEDDGLWRALADPTRREILDMLRQGPLTTGEVCARFDTTRFAVMKHLAVLVDAKLVIVHRRGRERLNYLNPVPLQRALWRWLRPFEETAAQRLNELKDALEAETRSP